MGDPSAPAVVSKSTHQSTTTAKENENKRGIMACILTCLIVVIILFDGYWIVTPKETKIEHIKTLNKHLAEYSDALFAQKEALNKEIEQVTTQIEEEKEAIVDEQMVKEKDATIKKMEEELKELKEKLSNMMFDASLFCAECAMEKFPSCGARKDYLMRTHGDSEEKATQAVMASDVSCVSKKE